MKKQIMQGIGFGLGILLILVAVAFFIGGFWTGDERWHQTGGVLAGLGFLLFFGTGIAGI